MPVKEKMISLKIVLSTQNEKGVNKNYIENIISEEIPVLCINSSTMKERLMPFKVLNDNQENFWNHSGSWSYFLTEEDFDKLKEKIAVKINAWDAERSKAEKTAAEVKSDDDDLEELEVEVGYGNEYQTFANMSLTEKVEHLNGSKNRLNELLSQKNRDEATVTKVLIDTTRDAALINHTILDEALRLGDDEAKKFTQNLVDSTHEMVKSSAQLISENVFNNDLMNTLVQKSNGTIVQHMTRVYLNGIAFLSYYNNLVSTSSAIQKLRISFISRYRNYYRKLLPHIDPDNIHLERVFYGGMRAIPLDQYYKWAVGFLVHDIGKAAAVEYHEGESSYDRNIVIEHVKLGYKSVMNKTNYPMEAALITGYHHEYYGDPNGYGYFRAYLQQYKKLNPDAKVDYCITYDLEPMLDYHALAYFPAKVLEIIDVFDSLTDPHRVYKKPMQPVEALNMMREEFIVKHHKIDLVLFDIFAMYIREKEK